MDGSIVPGPLTLRAGLSIRQVWNLIKDTRKDPKRPDNVGRILTVTNGNFEFGDLLGDIEEVCHSHELRISAELRVLAFVLRKTVRTKGYAEFTRRDMKSTGIEIDRAADALKRLIKHGHLCKVGKGLAALPEVVAVSTTLRAVEGAFWGRPEVHSEFPKKQPLSALGTARNCTQSRSEVHSPTCSEVHSDIRPEVHSAATLGSALQEQHEVLSEMREEKPREGTEPHEGEQREDEAAQHIIDSESKSVELRGPPIGSDTSSPLAGAAVPQAFGVETAMTRSTRSIRRSVVVGVRSPGRPAKSDIPASGSPPTDEMRKQSSPNGLIVSGRNGDEHERI
jgi:hypothetical protein